MTLQIVVTPFVLNQHYFIFDDKNNLITNGVIPGTDNIVTSVDGILLTYQNKITDVKICGHKEFCSKYAKDLEKLKIDKYSNNNYNFTVEVKEIE